MIPHSLDTPKAVVRGVFGGPNEPSSWRFR